MIDVWIEDTMLCIRAGVGDFAPRDESQLRFWGFSFDQAKKSFTATVGEDQKLVAKVVDYMSRLQAQKTIGVDVANLLSRGAEAEALLKEALYLGTHFKQGDFAGCVNQEFIEFVNTRLARRLKDHQVKAALHLLNVRNGANFSVPGSGKTSVVLAVFEYLRSQGQLDSIFVVGPASCFGPWITEYGEVLGEAPRYEILAGGNVEDRRDKYRVSPRNASDLFLTTFQTLHRDWEHVRSLFNLHGIKFLLVFDEAHYIKQIDGAWANAALMVTQNAKMRCVLTGTPFPRNYTDAFNLFDALWPDASPITENQRTEIEVLTQKKDLTTAAEILNQAIGPLFYRVRKQDLGLARQELHPPIQIAMNKYERLIYDSIFGRVEFLSQEEYVRNVEVLARLKRGRLMRLRQSLSYIWLLQTAIEDYKEEILSDSPSLKEIIAHYRELELPAKVTALLSMVERLIAESEKVLIWSNFVLTLRLISEKLRERGYQVGLIYGATPIHKSDVTEELTRQEIIADFVGGPLQVLVANPAACAESISLHKTCSHAVYYDLSYNCAQYLQSLDRIHRVGGSEKKVANYYFLQYQDTIETDILTNLNTKAEAMSNLIDQPYSIYSLDMFGEDEELQAYDRLFAES